MSCMPNVVRLACLVIIRLKAAGALGIGQQSNEGIQGFLRMQRQLSESGCQDRTDCKCGCGAPLL